MCFFLCACVVASAKQTKVLDLRLRLWYYLHKVVFFCRWSRPVLMQRYILHVPADFARVKRPLDLNCYLSTSTMLLFKQLDWLTWGGDIFILGFSEFISNWILIKKNYTVFRHFFSKKESSKFC